MKRKVIRANEFILEDETGKVRASLDVGRDGPALWLYDERGNFLAMLGAGSHGPMLALFDGQGKTRAGLGMGEDGPAVVLCDENGKPRAALGAGRITTPDGKETRYPVSSLQLFGPDGKVIWQAP